MADGRKYYVLCGSNCKFESMTKEQILTAITQAVNGGTIGDIDTGFVTTIKTITGQPLRFFVGTQAMYDGLSDDQKTNLFAIITNDTEKEAIQETLTKLLADQTDHLTKINRLYDKTEANASGISDLNTAHNSLKTRVTNVEKKYCRPIASSYPVGTVVVALMTDAKTLESTFNLYYNSVRDAFFDHNYTDDYGGSTKLSGTWTSCGYMRTLAQVGSNYWGVYLVQRIS